MIIIIFILNYISKFVIEEDDGEKLDFVLPTQFAQSLMMTEPM